MYVKVSWNDVFGFWLSPSSVLRFNFSVGGLWKGGEKRSEGGPNHSRTKARKRTGNSFRLLLKWNRHKQVQLVSRRCQSALPRLLGIHELRFPSDFARDRVLIVCTCFVKYIYIYIVPVCCLLSLALSCSCLLVFSLTPSCLILSGAKIVPHTVQRKRFHFYSGFCNKYLFLKILHYWVNTKHFWSFQTLLFQIMEKNKLCLKDVCM